MKRRNVIAADLRSPKYRKKVMRDRTKYTRKTKYKPRPPRRGSAFSSGRYLTLSDPVAFFELRRAVVDAR